MVMVGPDHYQTLMLDREVDMDLMTTVFRRLVQRYEAAPDDAAAQERLTAVRRAYDVLRDPFRRRRYDEQLALADGSAIEPDAPSGPTPPVPAAPARAAIPVTSFAARLDRSRQQAVAVPVVPAPKPSNGTRTATMTVLDFGRYEGWSLRQIARHDPDYLEWLLRSPTGRQYRAQIEAILQPR